MTADDSDGTPGEAAAAFAWRILITLMTLMAFGVGALAFAGGRVPGLASTAPDRVDCLQRTYVNAVRAVAAYERAFAEGRIDVLDAEQEKAMLAVRKSLACSPAASDLWFAMARMTALNEGLSPRAIDYLLMSCRTGRNQEWNVRARLDAFGQLESRVPEPVRACLLNDRRILEIASRGRRAAGT